VDMLLGWKQRHEDLVRGETNGPSLPTIELSTVRGLLVPDGDSDVSGEDCEIFRDHILVFSNRHDIELQNIQARIQLPEPVVGCQLTYRPVGIEVSWGPERIQSVAYATGSGSVTQRGPSRPKRTQILQIERLSPQSNIELAFRTAKDRFHGLSPVFTVGSDPKDVNSFVLGTFTTSCYGVTQVQEFFAPIAYDDANRQLHAMDVYGDHTDWNVQLITEYL
ncbi:MAG: hypothetical protein KDA66_20900, partial [Planctomycetaceae bacterium]|nr:hypothetical protein [Planctomycetaceae bacterium]